MIVYYSVWGIYRERDASIFKNHYSDVRYVLTCIRVEVKASGRAFSRVVNDDRG